MASAAAILALERALLGRLCRLFGREAFQIDQERRRRLVAVVGFLREHLGDDFPKFG